MGDTGRGDRGGLGGYQTGHGPHLLEGPSGAFAQERHELHAAHPPPRGMTANAVCRAAPRDRFSWLVRYMSPSGLENPSCWVNGPVVSSIWETPTASSRAVMARLTTWHTTRTTVSARTGRDRASARTRSTASPMSTSARPLSAPVRGRHRFSRSSTATTQGGSLMGPSLGLEDGERLRVQDGGRVHALRAVGDLPVGLQVLPGLVGVAVLDDLGRHVAHHAPPDLREVPGDGEDLRGRGDEAPVDGARRGGSDPVEGAGLEVDGDLGEEPHPGAVGADLAQLRGPRLRQGDPVEVELVGDRIDEGVEVVDGLPRGGHSRRRAGERGVPGERGLLLGIPRVVDDVVEDAAERGGLVRLDRGDDLQLVVLVGPLELLGDARGGHDLGALADDDVGGLLVGALLLPLGDHFGLGAPVEHQVVLVEEQLGLGHGQGPDGGGVLGFGHDGGRDLLGERDLGGGEGHYLSFRWCGGVSVTAEEAAHELALRIGGLAGGLVGFAHARALGLGVEEVLEEQGVGAGLVGGGAADRVGGDPGLVGDLLDHPRGLVRSLPGAGGGLQVVDAGLEAADGLGGLLGAPLPPAGVGQQRLVALVAAVASRGVGGAVLRAVLGVVGVVCGAHAGLHSCCSDRAGPCGPPWIHPPVRAGSSWGSLKGDAGASFNPFKSRYGWFRGAPVLCLSFSMTRTVRPSRNSHTRSRRLERRSTSAASSATRWSSRSSLAMWRMTRGLCLFALRSALWTAHRPAPWRVFISHTSPSIS
nr:MAG TPA: hypothetical protein [Caudoviricetes sp.]